VLTWFQGKEQQTKVEVKGGQHPLWDEEFRWPIYESTDKKHRTLEISCFSKEPREDDLLGKGSIDISETLKTGEFDGKPH
jgi:C2 domain